jgi:hypothetical protein
MGQVETRSEFAGGMNIDEGGPAGRLGCGWGLGGKRRRQKSGVREE